MPFRPRSASVPDPSMTVQVLFASVPSNVPTGSYNVDVKLFANGTMVTRTGTALEVIKAGFEQYVADAARDHGLLYGLVTALMALLTGWFASVVFRKD